MSALALPEGVGGRRARGGPGCGVIGRRGGGPGGAGEPGTPGRLRLSRNVSPAPPGPAAGALALRGQHRALSRWGVQARGRLYFLGLGAFGWRGKGVCLCVWLWVYFLVFRFV